MLRKSMFLALLSVLLLLTACGGGAQPAAEPEAETPAAQNETRTVESATGPVDIPADPQRIVGLSIVYPEFLYALGVTPVAVQNYHAEFPSYLQSAFADVLKTGIAQTPNFEAILSAKPDLILAPVWWAEKDYEQLSKIAPTVLLPERATWAEELQDIAVVLNKTDVAEKVVSDLDAKIADAKAKLQAAVGTETVMYMSILPKEIIAYGENQSRGQLIHQKLGLTPVPAFPAGELSVSLSVETLPQYDPDHIILQLNDDSDAAIQTKLEEVKNSAVWKNLKAVKNGNVHVVGSVEWFNMSMSPVADASAVDDLLKLFLE